MKKRHALMTGLALIALSAAANADGLQVRGLAASCAACHGIRGVAPAGTGIESLAGQTQQDLLRKLRDFKSGSKPATLMHQLSKGYSDEQLAQLADYFSALTRSQP